MLHTEQLLPTARGELQCLSADRPATIDELTALRIAASSVNALLHSCVDQLRPTHSWEDIGLALGCSPTAARLRFARTGSSSAAVEVFWEEYEPQFQWDFLPSGFLHALYAAWRASVSPSEEIHPPKAFIRRLRRVLETTGGWRYTRARTSALSSVSEPLSHRAIGFSLPTADVAQYGFKRIG